MTVTTRADVTVGTAEFRRALTAVYPLRNKVKTGDALAQFRVRLILAGGWVYVAASNGTATGLAKVAIVEDTRGALGKLDPDDAPIRIDLQPRQALDINRQFASKAKASDIDHLLKIAVDIRDEDDRFVRFTDVGGMLSDGESHEVPFVDPHEMFPDVIRVTGEVLAAVGESTQGKQLATGGDTLAMFKKAGDVYDAPVQVEASGPTESRAFLVTVGAYFLGTLSSRHNDDDSLGKRDRARMAWLDELVARKLKSA